MNRTSPGRPRSAESHDAVLAAAFALLAERGYSGMSIEAVAERAGVGKATIYRWWPNRAAMAVEAFFDHTLGELAFPATGSAATDFRLQIRALAKLLRGPVGAAMRGIVGGMQTDPTLAEAFRNGWVNPRRQQGFERMMAARAAGETREPINVPAALSALYSPIYAPLLFGQGVPDDAAVNAVLDVVLAGIFLTEPGG